MVGGTIKRLVSEKGFGFIAADGNGGEFFFHKSEVVGGRWDDLREGDRVEFEMGKGPKGPRAERVVVT